MLRLTAGKVLIHLFIVVAFAVLTDDNLDFPGG